MCKTILSSFIQV